MPKVIQTLKTQKHPLQLTGTTPALSRRTFASHHITFPFILDRFALYFPAGCAQMVRASIWISSDDSTPTDAPPPGLSVLSFLCPNPYLIGDNIRLEFDTELTIDTRGTWLKLHVYNTDAFPHTLTATFSLTEHITEAP